MARTVYALDLEDLPLARLSEQKRKRRRHQFENKSEFTKDSFARLSKMQTHSTTNQKRERNNAGSPKMLREVPSQGSGMSSAPVTPNAQRPSIDDSTTKVCPPEGDKKDLQPGGQSAFKRADKKTSGDESGKEKGSTVVAAGMFKWEGVHCVCGILQATCLLKCC